MRSRLDGKGDRARALFAGGGKLSVQVLNEFTAVSRRKQRRDWREIDEAVADVLTMVDPPLPLTLDLHIRRGRWPRIISCRSTTR